MNEETIFSNGLFTNSQQNDADYNGKEWKVVTLSGVSGVLMGAGLLYAGQLAAKEFDKENTSEAMAPEAKETSHTLENGLQVAAVSDDLSFSEAFAAARAEVGPGGVFHWHGGIYNTYTADEWNAMSVEQKHDFAQQVKPEIHPDELSTPTDADTHVVVVHHVYHQENNSPIEETHQTSDDVQIAKDNPTDDGDVHIVGYGNVQGHLAVGVDLNGDGSADVAIIDVDDNQHISDPDIVVDREGNMATYGEIVHSQDPSMNNYTDNPNLPDADTTDADLQLIDV